MPAAADKGFFKTENDARLGMLLFYIVLIIFIPAIFNGFTTYDDPEYVTNNPYVQSGLTLKGVVWAFRAHGANWHPLTWLAHLLDGQLFGLDPKGHHLRQCPAARAERRPGFSRAEKSHGQDWSQLCRGAAVWFASVAGRVGGVGGGTQGCIVRIFLDAHAARLRCLREANRLGSPQPSAKIFCLGAGLVRPWVC